ncbi:DNA polymerase III subunit epsilon (plasmid) [Pseudomonas sp. FeN3W]|nr:DNA polymerase III subunit epsilon [Pseudomonas sp. FeN3W]
MSDVVKVDTDERVIFLDTETTGFLHDGGDRIVEIGAIEYINRVPTGRTYHVYLDPQRDVPEEAYNVHKLSRDDLVVLSKGRTFKDIAREFVEFMRGAELIAHNARFDVDFIDAELRNIGMPAIRSFDVVVTDSLQVANAKHPGQSNSLDALLKRYLGTDNYERDYHGALLDASLLARVYLLMTVKQNNLSFDGKQITTGSSLRVERLDHPDLVLATISGDELARHNRLLQRVAKESGGESPNFGM